LTVSRTETNVIAVKGEAESAGPPIQPPLAVVTIAALVSDEDSRGRLTAAVRSHATIDFCDAPPDLVAAVADRGASAVITEWRCARGAVVDSAVRSIRADYPTIPILIYAPLTPEGAHDMLDAARAGVVDLIIADIDDVGITLGRRLAMAQCTALSERIMVRLTPLVPPSVASLLDYLFRHARTAPTVADAAVALQVHRKTLALHCARAGLPSPSALACWTRLILTAQRLEDPGRTTERAAVELGFPSGSAFRNMLKRYTGLSPSDIRERGGAVSLVELLAARVASARPTEMSAAPRVRLRAEWRARPRVAPDPPRGSAN
jgi:AraC-like DNA-binding protein